MNNPTIERHPLTPFLPKDAKMQLFRMPSTSRAYSLKLESKAAMYERMLQEIGIK